MMKKTIIIMLAMLALAGTAVAGSITSSSATCTSGACVSENITDRSTSTVSIQVSGSFTATLVFEATSDGTNYASIAGYSIADGSLATQATAAGVWHISATGIRAVRVRASAYTSGTATVNFSQTVKEIYASLAGGGDASAANQTTLNGYVDGVEALLTTIDADTGNVATDTATLAATDFMLGTDFSTVMGTGSLILATQADDLANTSDGMQSSSFFYLFDGTTWDRVRGDSANGMLVNLGTNNDVSQSGIWSVRTQDGAGNTISSTSNALNVHIASGLTSDIAVDSAQTNNPVYVGGIFETTPTVIETGDSGALHMDANQILQTASYYDPCENAATTTLAISQADDAQLIAASAGTKIYVCGGMLVAAAAEIINFTEGTGTVCATGEAAVIGSTTQANGVSLAANGGFVVPGKGFHTNTAANALCLTQSGTSRVSGYITYVQK